MAIASLICAFVFAPLGIVFGHISLSQIKRTGEEGHGLAVAGLVISYLITVGTIIVLTVVVLFTIAVARHLDDESRLSPGHHRGADDSGRAGFRLSIRRPISAPTARIRPPPSRRASPTSRRAPAGCRPIRLEVSASMATNRGDIGIQLDNGKAPCTVNSFVEPGPAGVLRRHHLSPADHHAATRCAAVR